MTRHTRSLVYLYPADRTPPRPNMRESPLDLYDLQAQLRGDVEPEPRDWATSSWVPVIFLTGLIGLVVLILHLAELVD